MSRFRLQAEARSVPERLFDHHALPRPVFLFRQPRGAKLVDDRSKKRGADRQIKENVAVSSLLLVHAGEKFAQILVELRLHEIAGEVVEALDEPVPGGLIDAAGGELVDFLGGALAVDLGGEILARDSDDGEVFRKQVALGEIVERRDQLSLGEVAARAEDHDGARTAGFAQGFLVQLCRIIQRHASSSGLRTIDKTCVSAKNLKPSLAFRSEFGGAISEGTASYAPTKTVNQSATAG